jgi:Kef-type K+ transport system membrane component KefB
MTEAAVYPPSRHASVALKYGAMVGLPLLAVIGILRLGERLTHAPLALAATSGSGRTPGGAASFDLGLLLMQLITILVVARVVGWALRRIGQPQVVGEMAAGLLLGPSFLGWLAPGVSRALFPAASLGLLSSLSQVGLLVFMFLVGLELDLDLMRGKGRSAVVTSHASIIAPFLLGSALALLLYPRLSPPGTTFAGFALFIGAAMSVTAFPVLARILAERGLTQTRLGAIAVTCAAVDDVTAWCILAVVVVVVRSGAGGMPLWVTLGGSAVFIALMLTLGRRAARNLEASHERAGRLTQTLVFVTIVSLFVAAWITERLGIHALFGAFLCGAIMPKGGPFAAAVRGRFEDMMVVILLPIFFALTGLRTSVGLIDGADLWGYCLLVVVVAIAGKLGGAAIAARVTGMSWRDASMLGVLMNTRGLMELVILNIGLDLGILSAPLFAMLVLMALATTFMTSPLLSLIQARVRGADAAFAPAPVRAGAR